MAKVLIVSPDIVGRKMAGPAIRYWEMARAIASRHAVTLAVPAKEKGFDLSCPGVAAVSYDGSDSRLKDISRGHDLLLVQPFTMFRYPCLKELEAIKIIDLYDPFIIELLEHKKQDRLVERVMAHEHVRKILLDELALGDYFICASPRQKRFWLGVLMAAGKITPPSYDEDPSFEKMFGVVPFGIQENPPVRSAPAVKGVIPGIHPEDKVVIWGGGLWNWFDPQSVVKAMAMLAAESPHIKLFFMGGIHPNPDMPKSLRLTLDDTTRLSKRLGVYGKNVFFNEGWVPYEERGRYLLEADAGISTHFNNLETRYSFRTRILDYLWAGLPIITTEGDHMADLVVERGLGRVVRYNDAHGIKSAVMELVDGREANSIARRNVASVREGFAWARVCGPLLDFMASPRKAPEGIRVGASIKERPGLGDYGKLFYSYVKTEGTAKTLKRVSAFIHRRL